MIATIYMFTDATAYANPLKPSLEVNGVTLATEDDICRDESLVAFCQQRIWSYQMLVYARDAINRKGAMP